MPIFIRKTILILSVVFAAFYVWFNFGYVFFESKALFGLAGDSVIDSEDAIASTAYLFPISPNKQATAKKTEPTPQPVAVKYSFLLKVPSIGISAPIVLEPTTNEDRIYKQLEKGVVHYAETPLPGQPGTSVIIGHSSVYPWYQGKYGHIFAALSNLKAGDLIQVETNDRVLNYKITRSLFFSPNSADQKELESLEYTEGSSIILMTCWPTGTNSKRVAVRADLVLD